LNGTGRGASGPNTVFGLAIFGEPTAARQRGLTSLTTMTLLLASMSLEELALAHLINAEAEKTQFVLGTLSPTTVSLSPSNVTISNLLTVNASVRRTLQDALKKEMLLEFKFENILDLLASISPVSFPI
jgi:hypothetical protein